MSEPTILQEYKGFRLVRDLASETYVEHRKSCTRSASLDERTVRRINLEPAYMERVSRPLVLRPTAHGFALSSETKVTAADAFEISRKLESIAEGLAGDESAPGYLSRSEAERRLYQVVAELRAAHDTAMAGVV
jgi:hypothetical protein